MIIEKRKTNLTQPERNLPHPPEEVPKRLPQSPFLNDLFHRLNIIDSDNSFETNFHSGSSKRTGLKLAMWTWLSAFIDTLVLISISCFFTVIFSFLVKTSPESIVVLFIKNKNLVNVSVFLFALVIWTYLIFMRAFMGASIGEWTCNLRLGQPIQRFKISYLFKVIIRTTLIMASGIILLPLLSLLLARDLAGDISGLKIYSLQ